MTFLWRNLRAMWTFSYIGLIWRDDGPKSVAYSGHGEGLNNAAYQSVVGVGPIPVGQWRIGTFFDHPRLGPCVAHLTPIGDTNTYDRSGFFLHGDNAEQNHSASDGCIVVNGLAKRQAIRDSGDTLLNVTE